MIKGLRNIFRKKRNTAVIYVPPDQAENMTTGLIRHKMEQWQRRLFLSAVVTQDTTDFTQLILNYTGETTYPSRIILFGAADKSATSFLLPQDFPGEDKVLMPSWWNKGNGAFEFLFAYSDRGALVLRQESWREVFPNWISFNDHLYFFLGSYRGRKLWADIFEGLIKASVEGKDVEDIKKKMIAVYMSFMSKIYDSYQAEEGDVLNLLYIQQAMNSLETSKDRPGT